MTILVARPGGVLVELIQAGQGLALNAPAAAPGDHPGELTQAGQGLALNDLGGQRLVAALPAWWETKTISQIYGTELAARKSCANRFG